MKKKTLVVKSYRISKQNDKTVEKEAKKNKDSESGVIRKLVETLEK